MASLRRQVAASELDETKKPKKGKKKKSKRKAKEEL